MFDLYCHILLERYKIKFPCYFNGLFSWLIQGARTDATRFSVRSGGISTPDATVVRSSILLLEQKLQAKDER